MAADASTDLGAVAEMLAGATLAELAARRRQLDAQIRRAPADTSGKIDQADHTIEAIRARQQAWTERLRIDEAATRSTHTENGSNAAAVREPIRAHAALAALDRAHAHASERLEKAERQQVQRHDWLEAHADLVIERDLARRAERARETQVRIAATHIPEPGVHDILGPEPLMQRERLHWRHAVESTATYRARNPQALPTDGGACEQLLGMRPIGREAAREYDLAASAINTVITANLTTRPQEADIGIAL